MIKKQVQVTENDILEFEVQNEPQAEVESNIPSMDSPDWTKFILAQLTSDELVKDKPKCNGIRRMVEKYVGPIVERKIVQCFPPQSKDGTATIVFGVAILVTNKNHPSFPVGRLWEEDVADAGPINSPYPFNKHQSATASTRAEARVLRKILRINVISAEEGNMDDNKLAETGGEWEPEDKIGEEQIGFLDILCQRCDMDVVEFINSGTLQYKTINDVTREQAGKMMQYLDAIQRNEKPKPKVGKYNKEWNS